MGDSEVLTCRKKKEWKSSDIKKVNNLKGANQKENKYWWG